MNMAETDWELAGQETVEEETYYLFRCKRCGESITTQNKTIKILCPNCVRRDNHE